MSVQEHSALSERIRMVYERLFEESEQPIYIQIDEKEKICNEKFAKFLGFESAEALESDEKNFPIYYVRESTQSTILNSYYEASEHRAGAVSDITWKKIDGTFVKTDVITVPIPFEEHMLILNFIYSIHIRT